MNKFLFAALLAVAVISHNAAAQQYVTPIYTQNSGSVMQPYAPATTAPAAYAPTTYAPAVTTYNAPAAASNVIPLSGPASPPVPTYTSNATTGYGTAVYTNTAATPQLYAATAPVPASAQTQPDAYATYATQRHNGYNWTGCYLGGYAGGAFGGDANSSALLSQGGTFASGSAYNITNAPTSYGNGSGFLGGGTLGCNYELPTRAGMLTGLVMGAEAEGGSFHITGSGTDPNSGGVNGDTHDKTSLGSWDALVAGRVGAAFDRTFIYGKFGAVFTDAQSRISDNCTTSPCGTGTIDASGHKSVADAAIGGGVEYALANGWSVKGEYMYLDTNDSYQVCGAGGGSAAGSTFCSQHQLSGTHTVKLGLNYHFDAFGGNTGPRW